MKPNRRSVLAGALTASLTGLAAQPRSSAAAASPARPLKVLMLGGTNYVGPHLVRAALARGHEVTLFNRGITNPHFFPALEKLRGDRKRGPEALAALRGRKWDVVLDTWAQWPRMVEESVAALADKAEVYGYVSSIAAYPFEAYSKAGLTEDDSRAAPQTRDPARDDYGYRLNKALGEAAVERAFGDRGVIARGHSIIGHDYSRSPWNNAAYWVFRMKAGGPVLVPDDDTALVQYTDVADFCSFMVDMAERKAGGVYNAVTEPLKFKDYVNACQNLAGADAALVPVDKEFLIAHGGAPFEVVPQWIPLDDEGPGFYQISGARAAAAGLSFRPLGDTIRAVLGTYEDKPASWFEGWRAGTNRMSAETERFVLAAHQAAQRYGAAPAHRRD